MLPWIRTEKVAIAEVVITVSGSGLEEEEESGCGVCVENLILSLDEIVMVIENSSNWLGSINTTQEELLQGQIMESQVRLSISLATMESVSGGYNQP